MHAWQRRSPPSLFPPLILTHTSKYPSVVKYLPNLHLFFQISFCNLCRSRKYSPNIFHFPTSFRGCNCFQILTYSFKYPSRTSACSQKQNKFPVVKYLANVFSPLPPSNPVSTFSHRPPLPPLTTGHPS